MGKKKQIITKSKPKRKEKAREIKKSSQKKKAVVKTNDIKDKNLTPIKQKAKKVLNSNEKSKKKSSTKKHKKREVLSSEQKKELQKFIKDLENKSTIELKELLTKNNQVKTGTKQDMVNRCAQGKLLGALTNCPKCFGGRLRFNIDTGVYSCPGYMDDTDFVNCGFKATEGIVRNPWTD